MSTLAIVVVVVLAVLALLAIGGAIANARRHPARRGDFEADVAEVDRALAAAHAQDKGWEPRALEARARQAFESERPGTTVRAQALVQVLDRPGTDEDKAVFRFVTDRGEARLTLGRSAGEWIVETVQEGP